MRRSSSGQVVYLVPCALLLMTTTALLSIFVPTITEGAKLADIYWNSSNPIFRIDNTDHIFDVNKKQNDHDQVDLVCPQPLQQQVAASNDLHRNNNNNLTQSNNDLAQQQQQQPERYIIYSVSKEEYDTCRLTGNPRVVALCDQTSGRQRPPFTVTFRPFTPQPNGLEFRAGQDYYFISALPGNPNDPKRFSPCRDLNMRVIFKVCCKSAAASSPSSSLVTQISGNSVSNSQQQPAAPSKQSVGVSLLSLSPTQRPTTQLLVSSSSTSRRPSVITLRPSLIQQQQQQQLSSQRPLEDYFLRGHTSATPLAGAPSYVAANGIAQQQQQNPVTVLPIEVLQPASSEQPQTPSSSTLTNNELNNDNNNNNNDIVLNDTQPSSTPRPLAPHFPPAADNFWPFAGQQSFGQQQQQQPPRPPLLSIFDPKQPPRMLLDTNRYKPTSLPTSLTNQQQQMMTSAHRQVRPEPAPQQRPQLRGELYPQMPIWIQQYDSAPSRVSIRDLTSGANSLSGWQHQMLLILSAVTLQTLLRARLFLLDR